MELPWRLLVIACHFINNLSANVINVEDKALEIEIPSGYMLVYEDQALQEGAPQNQPELTDSVFANRDQEHSQESLDQLHSPPAPPTLTLGDPQHQRGGAPHPLASRPRWDEPGGLGGEYAWSGEDLQRIGGGQREPQRRVGLNLEPVLAPKNFTVAGQEVKHHLRLTFTNTAWCSSKITQRHDLSIAIGIILLLQICNKIAVSRICIRLEDFRNSSLHMRFRITKSYID